MLTIICTRLFILVFTILNTFDIPVFCWLTLRLRRDNNVNVNEEANCRTKCNFSHHSVVTTIVVKKRKLCARITKRLKNAQNTTTFVLRKNVLKDDISVSCATPLNCVQQRFSKCEARLAWGRQRASGKVRRQKK